MVGQLHGGTKLFVWIIISHGSLADGVCLWIICFFVLYLPIRISILYTNLSFIIRLLFNSNQIFIYKRRPDISTNSVITAADTHQTRITDIILLLFMICFLYIIIYSYRRVVSKFWQFGQYPHPQPVITFLKTHYGRCILSYNVCSYVPATVLLHARRPTTRRTHRRNLLSIRHSASKCDHQCV